MNVGGRKLWDADAVCPFFRDHRKSSIGCEGILPGSVLRSEYQGREEREKQYKIYCCENYRYCEIYRAIKEKYEDEDDEQD